MCFLLDKKVLRFVSVLITLFAAIYFILVLLGSHCFYAVLNYVTLVCMLLSLFCVCICFRYVAIPSLDGYNGNHQCAITL